MAFHLVVGVALIVVGATLVGLRRLIVARHGARGHAAAPPIAFAVGGTILAAAGVIQLILAFG